MTISELLRVLAIYPRHARVCITFPDDEKEPVLVTYDAKNMILRLCSHADDVGATEQVIEDYSPESGRNGVGS